MDMVQVRLMDNMWCYPVSAIALVSIADSNRILGRAYACSLYRDYEIPEQVPLPQHRQDVVSYVTSGSDKVLS